MVKCNRQNFLQRLKKQKEDALEFIVDEYYALVKGTVMKVLSPFGQSGAVEECINDVFLAIWNHSGTFHGDETDFKKWVYKIAKFQAIDYYRRLSKRQEAQLQEHMPETAASLEEHVLKQEDADELLTLLRTMPPLDQQIFTMKYYLDIQPEMIAQRLGISRSVVDNHVYRGKKKLRQQILEIGLGEM